MKILIFYTYNKGLLSEFFQEVSGQLARDGYEVVNFYLKHKKDVFEHKGVRVYGERRGNFIHNYYQIYKIIRHTKPDVIVSNFSFINPAILFGRLLGVKKNIAWFHTAYEHTQPSKLKVFNKGFYLRLADTVITNSRLLQEEMHRVYGVSKQKTRCVPFWTHIAKYRGVKTPLSIENGSKTLKIGCPGRLVSDKNHQVLIEAFHSLKKEHQRPMHVYIAGGGPYQSELAALADRLEVRDQVSFMGILNVQEMVEFYDGMDVVVLPSLNEAFGLVFIEAIALGRPVIVSSKFGALNFVDSHKFPLNSITFNPTSVSDLKEKLKPYLANEGLPGDYFRELYEATFDKERIYERIKEIVLS